MTRLRQASLAAYLSGALLFAVASAQTPVDAVVTVVGLAAPTNPSTAIVRQAAIQDALRTAVQQVVGVLLTSTTLVENYELVNDRVYSRAAGVAYLVRVVEEGYVEGGSYRVRAEVGVREADVEELLHAAIRSNGDPTALVEVHGGPDSAIGSLQAKAQAALVGHGFSVVTHRETRAVARDSLRALSVGADVLVQIVFQAVANPDPVAAVRDAGLTSVNAEVAVSVLDAASGRIIVSATGQAVRASTTFNLAASDAVALAYDRLSPQVSAEIIAWVQGAGGVRRTVIIELEAVGDFAIVQGLVATLSQQLGTVAELRQYSGANAVVELTHPGRIDSILSVLTDIGWVITAVDGATIRARRD